MPSLLYVLCSAVPISEVQMFYVIMFWWFNVVIFQYSKVTVNWKFGHCYCFCNFFDALCSNYWLLIVLGGGKNFPIKREQGVNNCFKRLILSVFTTVASRLKWEQREKEK